MPSSWLANGKNARGNASTQPRPNTNTSNDCEMRPTITPTARSPGVTCSSCEGSACGRPGAGLWVKVSLVDMTFAWIVCSGCWTVGANCTDAARGIQRFSRANALMQIKTASLLVRTAAETTKME